MKNIIQLMKTVGLSFNLPFMITLCLITISADIDITPLTWTILIMSTLGAACGLIEMVMPK